MPSTPKLRRVWPLLLLAACGAPQSRAPDFSFSETWQAISDALPDAPVTATPASIDTAWWKQFNDDVLNALVDLAVSGNPDIKIARARLAEARADRRFAQASLLPLADGFATATRGKTAVAAASTVYEAGFDASWELDVFGGLRAEQAAARAGEQAAAADYSQTMVTLLAEVARNYVEVRNFQQQKSIAARNLEAQRKTLELTRQRYEAGSVSALDVTRAQAQADVTAALIPQLDTSLKAALNRLSVLTGAQPGGINTMLAEQLPMPGAPMAVVVSTPAATIAARPDVRAAERRLAQAASLSDAAFADLFPRVSLTGLFATQDSSRLGSASPWSAGASLVLPLIDFGRIRANINAADARQDQALQAYEKTVLAALEDTENSLTAFLNEQIRLASLRSAVEQNRRAAELARLRYEAGASSFLDVLAAERSLLDSESQLAQSEALVTQNLIALYKSLGGEWSPDPMLATAAPVPPPASTPPAEPAVQAAPVAPVEAAPVPDSQTAPAPVPTQEMPMFMPLLDEYSSSA